MGLREKLDEILPAILPGNAESAIKGKELIARVREVLGDEYSDHSLRSQFSFMVLDADSCLARVEMARAITCAVMAMNPISRMSLVAMQRVKPPCTRPWPWLCACTILPDRASSSTR